VRSQKNYSIAILLNTYSTYIKKSNSDSFVVTRIEGNSGVCSKSLEKICISISVKFHCRKFLIFDKSMDDRDFDYGIDVEDPKKIPRGPYFIQEPVNTVFDLSRNIPRSYTSLRQVRSISCLLYFIPELLT